MKVLRKILSFVAVGTIGLFILLFVINYFVRVSDGQSSYGIIEEKLFGKSAISAFFRSLKPENWRRWKDSSQLSKQLASIIEKEGIELIINPNLEEERIASVAKAFEAYNLSNTIPKKYLNESNPELGNVYQEHFVKAIRFWAEGLNKKDYEMISTGIQHYNSFLVWIQSKNRKDFKAMK